MLKILQARLQQHVNSELPDVLAGFRKGRGTRDQIANICWIIEKAKSSRKTFVSALLTMGDLPDPRIKPRSPALQEDSLPTELPGKPHLSTQLQYNPFSF